MIKLISQLSTKKTRLSMKKVYLDYVSVVRELVGYA